jgi:hypothetical protein
MTWFLRKFFGTIALLWVIAVALAILLFLIRSVVQAPELVHPVAAIFLLCYFGATIGFPSAVIWFALKLVQSKSEARHLRADGPRTAARSLPPFCSICRSVVADWACSTHRGFFCQACSGRHSAQFSNCKWVAVRTKER